MIPIPSPDFPAYLLRSHHLQFLLYLSSLLFSLQTYISFIWSFIFLSPRQLEESQILQRGQIWVTLHSSLFWGGQVGGGMRLFCRQIATRFEKNSAWSRKLPKDLSGNFLKNTRNKQKWDRVGAVLTPPLLFWPGIGRVRRVPGWPMNNNKLTLIFGAIYIIIYINIHA